MISTDTIDYLRDGESVADLVDVRIFDTVAPQDESLPNITVQELTVTPEYGLGGEIGVHKALVQVDCWAQDPKGALQAKRLGDAVRGRMSGFKGEFNGTRVSSCLMVRGSLLEEETEDGSGDYYHRFSMDFEIYHGASVPDFA